MFIKKRGMIHEVVAGEDEKRICIGAAGAVIGGE